LERETGIEPATNGLGSRYSTIELLPLTFNRNQVTTGANCGATRLLDRFDEAIW
jgi:hypothetical protein